MIHLLKSYYLFVPDKVEGNLDKLCFAGDQGRFCSSLCMREIMENLQEFYVFNYYCSRCKQVVNKTYDESVGVLRVKVQAVT